MSAMLDCHDVMLQLWDYLDGELTPQRMAEIRLHLSMCARCQPHMEFERAFLDVLQQTRDDNPDPLPLAARVRAALQAAGCHLH